MLNKQKFACWNARRKTETNKNSLSLPSMSKTMNKIMLIFQLYQSQKGRHGQHSPSSVQDEFYASVVLYNVHSCRIHSQLAVHGSL